MENEARVAHIQHFHFFLNKLNQLSSLSTTNVWLLLVGSIICIAVTDGVGLRYQFIIGPIYVLPICLAGWRLRLSHALWFAVLTALVTLTFTFVLNGYTNHIAAATNVTVRLFMYCVLTIIVSTFRYSFDQEHFRANRDPVTGALNKRAFAHQAEAMLTSAAAGGRTLLLAFIDLDGFKLVNDQHGHNAGDNVLRSFGDGAAAYVRRRDSLGRIGGDEFAVLLTLESAEDGHLVGQKLHKRLSSVLAGVGLPVTCSMGALIVPPDHGHQLLELMREADKVMYSVKHAGKNDVRVATLTKSNVLPQISDRPSAIPTWQADNQVA